MATLGDIGVSYHSKITMRRYVFHLKKSEGTAQSQYENDTELIDPPKK